MEIDAGEAGAGAYEPPHVQEHGKVAEATGMQTFGTEADVMIPQGQSVFGKLSF